MNNYSKSNLEQKQVNKISLQIGLLDVGALRFCYLEMSVLVYSLLTRAGQILFELSLFIG